MRFTIFLLFLANTAHAQIPPIGNWRDHLPYSQATDVFNSAGKIWTTTSFSLFSIDKDDQTIERRSKVNGLTETGITAAGIDSITGTAIVAYRNSNIDVIRNGTISNISDIKNFPGNKDKTIFDIYILQDNAYLSSGLGIIVLDLIKNQAKDTYVLGANGENIKVNSLVSFNNFFYAATDEGLKAAPLTGSNLSDFRTWQLVSGTNGLPSGAIKDIDAIGNRLIVLKNDSLYSSSTGAWSFFYADGWKINNLNSSGGKILLSQSLSTQGRVVVLNPDGSNDRIIQSPGFTILPKNAIAEGNSFWIADSLRGLSRLEGNIFTSFIPNSPASTADGQIVSSNNRVWVAAGSVTNNWEPKQNRSGIYKFNSDSWTNFNANTKNGFDSLPDIISVAIDPRDNSLWAGSYGGGLINLKENNELIVYKQNSPLQVMQTVPGAYRVSGLAFDTETNLWISNYGASQNLHVRKADGSWRSFSIPFPLVESAAADIVIDDFNQKWIIAPKGQGLIVFNHGQSIDNPGDDQWKWYRAGAGNGNLPDNTVLSIVKDKNGFIWVGTAKGIGIIQCPGEVFTASGCEAILPVVQQDNFPGYLFRDEEVQAIAVDGADRKWVGTRNGIWLISSDAEKTLFRFTADDSPLPSNDIRKIGIDGITGEVFIATAEGIVSYRSTATEGTPVNTNVLVFPNPVPPGYAGTIAIRGVANNSIVKITEMDGRLVFQTRASGGQAVWNGKNYKGQTISTGVYLVFISDDAKVERLVTKIIFVKK